MPSPFPGMNPYLEQSYVWEEFHNKFISALQDDLVVAAGPNYVVKMETGLYVHELSEEERHFVGKADVSISAGSQAKNAAAGTGMAVAPAPINVVFPTVETELYTWLEILDRSSRKVVTVIELLSPTNKAAGPDRDDYLSKRSLHFYGPANFIEIDLRRGGTRPQPPPLPACDYYVFLSRKKDWPNHGFWPLQLNDQLPVIPVPLSPTDADVSADLQAILNRVYDAAGYGNYIYSETPEPPLAAEDEAWAKQFIPVAQRTGM